MTHDPRVEQFVRLQSKYQQRVFSFILTMVPNWADAEEVLQETSTILWRKFDQFDPSTDFVRWANQVAYFEVLKHRKNQARDRLQFSSEFLESVLDRGNELVDALAEEREALTECVEKLSDEDRRLLAARYAEGASTKSTADALDRPVGSVYKSVARVRTTLLDCVRRTLARKARP